jgi:hypothetical protein
VALPVDDTFVSDNIRNAVESTRVTLARHEFDITCPNVTTRDGDGLFDVGANIE